MTLPKISIVKGVYVTDLSIQGQLAKVRKRNVYISSIDEFMPVVYLGKQMKFKFIPSRNLCPYSARPTPSKKHKRYLAALRRVWHQRRA